MILQRVNLSLAFMFSTIEPKKDKSKSKLFKTMMNNLPNTIGNAMMQAKNEKQMLKLQRVLNYDYNYTLSSQQRRNLQKFVYRHEIPQRLRCELWLRGSGAKTLMNDPSNIKQVIYFLIELTNFHIKSIHYANWGFK